MSNEFIKIKNLSQSFEGTDVPILENINLTINEGEFVAILGPSGSGKSTLLRLITGLIQPTDGEILFEGEKVDAVNPYASVVFQNFALYPWLSVVENVELGLKARGFPNDYSREKAVELIDLIGLDGFEDAYPKELSGGMKQRVGFARALAVQPKLLCMDEPFSALDFLTAENLRTELIELWTDKKMPIKSIILVTHGIEEAVLMADRIVILSKKPASIIADIKVNLPYPRNRKSQEFEKIVDNIYKVFTRGKAEDKDKDDEKEIKNEEMKIDEDESFKKPVLIPNAFIGVMSGLLELIYDNNGWMDIYQLGRDLMMELDALLPNIEGIELLKFAEVKEGDIFITDLGKTFVEGDTDESKAIFRNQILDLSTFKVILNVLNNKKNKTMKREFFEELLMHYFSEYDSAQLMDIVIDWGRYAEIFNYDYDTEELYIETEEE